MITQKDRERMNAALAAHAANAAETKPANRKPTKPPTTRDIIGGVCVVAMVLAVVIGGAIASAAGAGSGPSASVFCDDFKDKASGWIPETLGGSAAVNDLPSDADLEHEAYQLSTEAPADLASEMNTLVSAAGSHDSATFYSTAASIAHSCRTE